MMDISRLPPLRKVIEEYGLAARKGLGQHFLLDINLTQSIVRKVGDLKGVNVFEIGPGPGGLTRAILASDAAQLIAIEKDPRCVIALEQLIPSSEGRFSLQEEDALKINLAELAPAPRAIIANLPYNVGTAMLINWLKQIDDFQSLTLMFQAEVVDRLLAKPQTKAYGRLSILTQFCCQGSRLMSLPARAFTPPPKVDSAVVHLRPRTDRPKDVPLDILEKITAAAFGQRRKMLRASLRNLGGIALLEEAGIDEKKRAEELRLSDFETLVRAYQRLNSCP